MESNLENNTENNPQNNTGNHQFGKMVNGYLFWQLFAGIVLSDIGAVIMFFRSGAWNPAVLVYSMMPLFVCGLIYLIVRLILGFTCDIKISLAHKRKGMMLGFSVLLAVLEVILYLKN